jgi:hypothetical protein
MQGLPTKAMNEESKNVNEDRWSLTSKYKTKDTFNVEGYSLLLNL